MSSPIDKLISDYNELTKFLLESGKLSESINVKDHYRKILLLSCASYYETKIISAIKAFVKQKSSDERLCEFINNKAINRQYHTYFDWKEKNNINNFLGLFGNDFKKKISAEIKQDVSLSNNVSAFLTIGAERNLIVHENFLEYNLEKTFEEIVELHNKAIQFIEYLEKQLLE